MKILSLIYCCLISSICFSQLNSFICGTQDGVNSELGNPGPLEFIPIEGCKPLNVKCNFVFFTRADGGGTFNPNNSDHMTILDYQTNFINWRLGYIENPLNCTYDISYPRDSKLRVEIERHYIANEGAWDYFSHGGVDCPGSITSQILQNAIDDFNTLHPKQFNFFFLEDGDEVNYLENLILNNIPLNIPYNNNVNAWFNGCSDLAHNYYSDNAQYIIVADFYTEYLKRRFFHQVYYPSFASIPWQTITGWHTNDVYPTMLVHELGHTVLDQYHTNGCNNIMRNDGLDRSHLSKSQLNKLHMTFATKNLHSFVNCNELEGANCTIRTTGDHTVNYPMSVFGNLTVKSGHQLTISNKVTFSSESRLIVERGGKLILNNNAFLTTECNDIWQGIIVEGNSTNSQATSGVVELKSGSIIENAKTAISCNPLHIPWPNDGYYGGLIKAEGGIIRNCGKGAEFMKYGVNNIEDNSYFTNVTFTNCKNGVTLWANNGVEFTNCTFSSILENGILPLDSRAVITGCTFNDVKTGVNVHSTMPIPFSTEIHSNDFYTSNEGVKANATANSTSLDIYNNNFFGSYFGLLMSGASHYHVQKNDFINQNTSTIFYDTNLGIDDQMVDNNVYSSEVGSLANKSNYTVYVDNCFGYNGNADLNISSASIFPFQYDTEIDDEAAGNCFTKNGVKDIYTSNNSHFYYYIKNSETNLCKIPTTPGPNTSNGNFSLAYASMDDESECGSSTGPGITFVKYRKCLVPKTKTELLQAIVDLKALIHFYEQTAIENSFHYFLVKKYKACLKRLLVSIPGVYKLEAFPNWREEAISYVNNETDFQVKAFAYALMIENNEFSNARAWLTALNRNTEEIQDFFTIQNINLDYLENRDQYQISNANKTLLYDLGRKDIPYNGFARSLHFVLTGEEVPIDLDYGNMPTTPRSKSTNKDWVIEQYPNPVNGQEYTINMTAANTEDVYEVNIIDLHGKSIFTSSYKGSKELKIDNNTWASGIYFVKISTQKEVLCVNKLIKI
jgi:hypothetical protein